VTVQLIYNFTLVYFYGINTLLYLILSTVICGRFHPTAGHFLSEHLEMVRDIETYSYYRLFNYVTYNITIYQSSVEPFAHSETHRGGVLRYVACLRVLDWYYLGLCYQSEN